MRVFAAARPASHLYRLFVFALLALACSLGWAAPGALLGKTLTAIPGGDDYLHRAVVQSDGKIVVAGAARFGTLQYEITRYNADGTLDTAFGNHGTVLEPLGPGNGEAWALAVQSDGKIVVAGHVRSDRDRFGLARFNADGSLDTSFGGGGVATAVGPGDSGGYAMVIQPDGKIVLGGYSMGPSGKKVFTLVRYNKDTTTLDTSFGSGGAVVTGEAVGDEVIHALGLQSTGKIVAAGSGSNYIALHRYNTDGSMDLSWGSGSVPQILGGWDLVVQPDDKVAIAGTVPDGSIADLGILRMTADGNVDGTFGSGQCPLGSCVGIAYVPAGDEAAGYGIALQSDGKLVVSGNTALAAGSGTAVAIARFNADGSVDSTFGSKVVQPSGSGDMGFGLAMRSNGGFIVAGQAAGDHGDYDSLTVAFTSSGALDTGFNGTGFARLDAGKVGGEALDAALQSDGKLVVAGIVTPENHTTNPTPTYGALVRYLPDGTLDSTFGAGGVVNMNWAAKAVAMEGSQIVAAGFSGTAMAFGRFNADGSVDTHFGTGGLTTFPLSGDQEFVNDIAVQGDGSIVGAGVIRHNGTFSDSAIVRVTGTGAIDSSLGGSGKVVAAMSTGNDEANGIAIQADGKIVAAGWGDVSGSQDSFTAIRVNTDGSIDTSFGTGGIATINFSTNSSFARALAIQPDGKIVIGGKVFSPSSSTDDFAVARLMPDGSPDSSFGTGGTVSSDFGNHNRINALALLTSGAIVGAGEDGGLFGVVQYHSDGTLDTTFGSGGNSEFQVNAGNDYASAIAVGSDGTLYLAGNGSGLFGLARVAGGSSLPPPATATVSLASSANPSTAGQSVTFTASVTGGSGTPTGTVTFRDGTTTICNAVALSSGTAACSAASLTTGTHSITASYSGDATYGAATSSALSQTVNATSPATATVSLASSANPSQEGQIITFTATVTGGSGTPTGTVTFLNGSSAMCSNVALANGAATCSVVIFNTGTYTITANYSGDGTYGAASGTLTQTVNPSSGTASANVALASAGAVATASSTYSSTYAPANAINGDRTGASTKGGIWLDATRSTFPDWFEVQFASAQTIDHVIVYSMQDGTPVEPTDTMTFTKYGVVDFQVQVWNGSSWVTAASVSGNNLVKRTVTFPQVSTDRIRVLITYALGGSSRLAEVEAWTVGSTTTTHVATVGLASSANPSNQGQAVTFTANVTGSAGTPTGSVTFVDGSTAICAAVPLSSGVATCTTSSLAAGAHSITARYSGDSTYDFATSSTLTQTVNSTSGANASVALASSANPSNFGDTVTFTATVSGSAGTPTGTVTFLDGSITLCSAVALSSGQATCASSSLSSGTHSITAQYSGDGTYPSATSSALSQTVNSANAPFNVALATQGAVATASSTYSSTYAPANAINGDRTGASTKGGIWLDATRSAFPDWLQVQFVGTETIGSVVVYSMQDGTPVEPTDTMTFTKYGVVDFQVQVWNGSGWVTAASVSGNNLVKRTVTFTPVATDRIRVLITYALGGSSRLAEVEAWTAGGTTSTATATVALASSANPSNVGDAVTFTATVSGSAGAPTGNVTFMDGSTTLCGTVPISSGQATCTTSGLTAGTHSIVAQYLGDATYPSATSSPLSQSVNSASAASATVALTSSANPSTSGQSVTFTASVSGSSGMATGTVTFADNGSPLCSGVSLSSGLATCTTSFLTEGTHSITASYSGDGTYGAASSNALSQVVNPASGTSVNVALASSGSVATASSTYSSTYAPANAINGDRTGASMSGGIWLDGTRSTFPDWLQVQFPSTKTIDRVVVYSMQDNYSSPVEPTDTMTFTKYGVVDFQVQAWNGSSWVTVASVSGNDLVKRTVTFSPVSTDRIRVLITMALGGSSRLAEVEAWTN